MKMKTIKCGDVIRRLQDVDIKRYPKSSDKDYPFAVEFRLDGQLIWADDFVEELSDEVLLQTLSDTAREGLLFTEYGRGE